MISIDSHDSRPLYEQVEDGFIKLIAAGVMAPDDKLPSVRALASQLAINPNTIQRAYRELESRGYIYSTAGKGSFVCATDETNQLQRKEMLEEFDALVKKLKALGCTSNELTKRLEGGNNND